MEVNPTAPGRDPSFGQLRRRRRAWTASARRPRYVQSSGSGQKREGVEHGPSDLLHAEVPRAARTVDAGTANPSKAPCCQTRRLNLTKPKFYGAGTTRRAAQEELVLDGGSLQVTESTACVLTESTKLRLSRARRGKVLDRPGCVSTCEHPSGPRQLLLRARAKNGRERRHNV